MIVVCDDGIRLHVAIHGPEDADAVLFLNSLGCDLAMWDEQARELSADFRVIRFDMRGHGRSDPPHGDFMLGRLGQDAIAVLNAAGVKRAHLCGLSLGGITAQWLAIHAPERLKRLILGNTAARIGTVETWQTRHDTVLKHGVGAIADAVIGRFFSEGFRAKSPSIVAGFRQALLATSPVGYAGCCAALRDADLRAEIRHIAAPTLVIGGTQDVSTPIADAEFLADGIAGAGLAIMDTAHLSNVEKPAEFTAHIQKHLEAGHG
jgi:3-oxoadipate enol-lactonase